MPKLSALAVAALLTIAACGDTASPSENSNARCTVTIAGVAAIAGSYTCLSTPITIWVPNTNVGALNLNISGPTSISGLFVFSGQPSVGTTYNSSNSAGLQSYGFIVSVGTASWEFSAGQQAAPLGNGSLTFSSVQVANSGTSGTVYSAHGTIDATLVPGPGTTASGTATMHVVF